jgi:uncharacterized protein YdhG (YjbR/CyaY superfamily)
MSVIDNYIASLHDPDQTVIAHMYEVVRELVPDHTEELSYAMPACKYNGMGLVAIMANKHFLSLYPFGAVENLGLDLSAYECTTGSIHFSAQNPLPDELLRQIIVVRLEQIKASSR